MGGILFNIIRNNLDVWEKLEVESSKLKVSEEYYIVRAKSRTYNNFAF